MQAMHDGRRQLPASSGAFIPDDSPLRRLPLKPDRKRPAAFLDSYEDRAVVYDCFWDEDRERVILVGPPAYNLEPYLRAARFTADDDGQALNARIYPSRSTTLIALHGVSKDAREIVLRFSDLQFRLAIQPNDSVRFAGRDVLVTLNKDNDLDWIIAWAKWHVRLHGADGCIFFDNGSTRYSSADVAAALGSVEGMEEICVLSWPHKYGRKDPALLNRPHYPHFLQVSSLNVALRRFAARASGLLNCDIDELVGTADKGSIFSQVRESPEGLITLRGRWVEPVARDAFQHGLPHLAYRYAQKIPLLSRCANKWVLDPRRQWIKDLSAKPSVHRMYDVTKSLMRSAPQAPFWHFKAINTGWKEARSGDRAPAFALTRLNALDRDAERFEQAETSFTGNAPRP